MDIIKFIATQLITDKIGKYLTNKLTIDDINISRDGVLIKKLYFDVDEICNISFLAPFIELYHIKPDVIYCDNLSFSVTAYQKELPPLNIEKVTIVLDDTQYKYIDFIVSSIYSSEASIENIEALAFNKIKQENSSIFGNDDVIINSISDIIEKFLLNFNIHIDVIDITINSKDIKLNAIISGLYCDDTQKIVKNVDVYNNDVLLGTINGITVKLNYNKNYSDGDLSKSSYIDFDDYDVQINSVCNIDSIIIHNWLDIVSENETIAQIQSQKRNRIHKEIIKKYNFNQRINIQEFQAKFIDLYCSNVAIKIIPDEIQMVVDKINIDVNKIPESNKSNNELFTNYKFKCNLLTINLTSDTPDYVQFCIHKPMFVKKNSNIYVNIHDVNVFDYIQKSQWNKLLCRNIKKSDEHQDFLKLQYNIDTYSVKLNIIPLRLFINQLTLNYLLTFMVFNENEDKIFKRVETNDIRLTIDYKPVKFNIHSTEYTELINLLPLENFYIKLPAIDESYKSMTDISEIWQAQLENTIAFKYLKSIMIINSVMTILEGVSDLFVVPYDEYVNHNETIINGISLGISNFIDKISQGCIDILSRFTISMNSIIELGISPFQDIQKENSKFSNQPNNITEGITDAYNNMANELIDTGNIILLPFQQETLTDGITTVGTSIPVIILKPVSASLISISKILLGIKNNINNQHKIEMDNKYGS